MIICFNKKINTLTENFFNSQSLQSLMPSLNDVKDAKCPLCKSKYTLSNYGHYNRNLSFYFNHNIYHFIVSIQRVKCSSCNKTHALLPHFIVPYVIMASFSIASIVADASNSSVYQLSQKINLSCQMIYKYIAIVLAFFTDFKILNNSKEYVPTTNFNEKYFLTNCVQFTDYQHLLDFFLLHHWILFMLRFRNNPSPPVSIFIQF